MRSGDTILNSNKFKCTWRAGDLAHSLGHASDNQTKISLHGTKCMINGNSGKKQMKIELSMRKDIICLLFLSACNEIDFVTGSNSENLSTDEAGSLLT